MTRVSQGVSAALAAWLRGGRTPPGMCWVVTGSGDAFAVHSTCLLLSLDADASRWLAADLLAAAAGLPPAPVFAWRAAAEQASRCWPCSVFASAAALFGRAATCDDIAGFWARVGDAVVWCETNVLISIALAPETRARLLELLDVESAGAPAYTLHATPMDAQAALSRARLRNVNPLRYN